MSDADPYAEPYFRGEPPRAARRARPWLAGLLAGAAIRVQAGALLLAVAGSLLPVLWAGAAPTGAQARALSAVGWPDRPVQRVDHPSALRQPAELAAIRAGLQPEPAAGSDTGQASPALDAAADRLTAHGWTRRGYVDSGGGYVELTRDGQLARLYPDDVVLLRTPPPGSGRFGALGLLVGAVVGLLTALRLPRRRSPAGTVLRLAIALALLVPTVIALGAVLSAEPVAGSLGVQLLALRWPVGSLLGLGLIGALVLRVMRR